MVGLFLLSSLLVPGIAGCFLVTLAGSMMPALLKNVICGESPRLRTRLSFPAFPCAPWAHDPSGGP